MSQLEPIDREVVRFSSDSQLLSELGERLIASRKVALAELIKNAYDADATKCNIWLTDSGETLVVKDDGHGMTEQEFRDHWMTIATSNRSENPTSRRYNREVTGSKGVGRFAVRNLGLELKLESVAYDPEADEHRRLVANFDWREFESGSGLSEMEIEYRLFDDVDESDEGTCLQISALRDDWSQSELEQVSDGVLDIVSAPYEPEPSNVAPESEEDPGFSVYFSPPGEEDVTESPAKEIYDRWTALAEINLDGRTVTYQYNHDSESFGGPSEYTYELEKNHIGELEGEVRFFDKSSGQFRGMETIDGRQVRTWLNENGGVRVMDKGFRMPPYGDKGNDWLNLSESHARRVRDWRSPITEALFPGDELSIDMRRAQLGLPRKSQVLGAVEVSSYRPGEESEEDETDRLVPAMDRQGFIQNEAFYQLQDIVRGALEGIAIIHKQAERREKIEKANRSRSKLDKVATSTVNKIETSSGVDSSEKDELVGEVRELKRQAEESVEAEREARKAVESMNLLGAVSAFMSHESSKILDNAQKLVRHWKSIPVEERDEKTQEVLEKTESTINDYKKHLGYAENFMKGLSEGDETQEINPKMQVKHVVNRFESYTIRRSITVENKIDFELDGPTMNIAVYSGVVTNLFTNAIKAVSEEAAPEEGNKIRFEAENTGEYHKLRVIDNGSGIDEEEEDEIFDPLYSTTNVEGPGSIGAGLGLYIVKNVVETQGGEIELVEPPEPYETAFEVRYPI
ncbi:sensor histidine kinase [Halostagnicola sp. A-GB9-2]|uniref:ATP-binding protein n=1 Tax=Halostagnicola sp. A-GB9-2 TaxID=3048066 RepID=UPI0024C0E66B|nr:sensor histidine kinase [Halostagnicola sp. A-GB9-2]MDJ1431145.1 sensor histidine kinase [Halostagnicola sp. A-GB9-2]